MGNSLPVEMFVEISEHLIIDDTMKASLTCKRFYGMFLHHYSSILGILKNRRFISPLSIKDCMISTGMSIVEVNNHIDLDNLLSSNLKYANIVVNSLLDYSEDSMKNSHGAVQLMVGIDKKVAFRRFASTVITKLRASGKKFKINIVDQNSNTKAERKIRTIYVGDGLYSNFICSGYVSACAKGDGCVCNRFPIAKIVFHLISKEYSCISFGVLMFIMAFCKNVKMHEYKPFVMENFKIIESCIYERITKFPRKARCPCLENSRCQKQIIKGLFVEKIYGNAEPSPRKLNCPLKTLAIISKIYPRADNLVRDIATNVTKRMKTMKIFEFMNINYYGVESCIANPKSKTALKMRDLNNIKSYLLMPNARFRLKVDVARSIINYWNFINER